MRYFCPDNQERSQVLIIVLWIMLTLSILALTIAHTTRMELKLGRSFTIRTHGYYAAKAGIVLAVNELKKDNNGFDSCAESWAVNAAFKDAAIEKNSAVTFSVVYRNDLGQAVYGVRDVERAININTCSPEILTALMEEAGIIDVAATVQNIRQWRGDLEGIELRLDSGRSVPYKAARFSSIEELALIPGMTDNLIAKIRPHIRVLGEEKININTIQAGTLEILIKGIALSMPAINGAAPAALTAKISDFRKKGGVVTNITELKGHLNLTGDDENNLFTALQEKLSVSSNFFLISAAGSAAQSGRVIKRDIEAVYDRIGDRIVFWHEN